VKRTDVLVVGGGATGLAVARDLALRGLAVTLVEMGDFASGTSGRYHGLLHSGARYAVTDPEAARECIAENRVLRLIAPSSIEDTGGLFVLCAGDDSSFEERWLDGCRQAGIPARPVSRAEALAWEPLLAPSVIRAFGVPDAVCNSHALCGLLERASLGSGATLLPFHRVDGLLVDSGRVAGAVARDLRADQRHEIRARVTVNAAGPWAGAVAAMAGIHPGMDLRRGAVAAWKGRLVRLAVQRLRMPGDADVILPRGGVTIGGTTEVPTEDPGDRRLGKGELEAMTAGLAELVPGLRDNPPAHAWSAVRPIFDPQQNVEPRAARGLSRSLSVIDHRSRDGVTGFVSVVGGKLTTCRLMAEKTADLACRALDVRAPCRTAETPL
jgi:glycerol-3-phosphate dehydrogenase